MYQVLPPTLHPPTVETATKDAAQALLAEVIASRNETARYRDAVVQLKRVLEALEEGLP